MFSEAAARRRNALTTLPRRLTQELYRVSCPKDWETAVMDTNTLLIIIVVIFLLGGFGFYGRGRWY